MVLHPPVETAQLFGKLILDESTTGKLPRTPFFVHDDSAAGIADAG